MKDLNKIFDPKNIQRLVEAENQHWGPHPSVIAGMFAVRSKVDRKELRVVATAGDGWDHVSVSRADRVPLWEEMEQVKRLFFEKYEVAYQLHVAEENHINRHPNCLHLWMCHNQKIPLPPRFMV